MRAVVAVFALLAVALACDRAGEADFKKGWRKNNCGGEFDATDVAKTVVKCIAAPELCIVIVEELMRKIVGDVVTMDMAKDMIVNHREVILKNGVSAKAALLTATQCKHCIWGNICYPRPNKFKVCVAYGKIGKDPVENPSHCHTIRNKCSKAIYTAAGYYNMGAWVTHGWWKISPGQDKRLCFNRGGTLYAHFDIQGDSSDQSSDLNFNIGKDANFCLKNSRTKIFERKTSPKFRDAYTGYTSNSCEGLGNGAQWRGFEKIDNGEYGSSNLRHCGSRANLRSAIAEVLEIIPDKDFPPNTTVLQLENSSEPLVMLSYNASSGWSSQEAENPPSK